jgi:hypothetical protein
MVNSYSLAACCIPVSTAAAIARVKGSAKCANYYCHLAAAALHLAHTHVCKHSKPMYFEMATDGELGLYKGSGPKDNQGKLWGSNTRTKTTTSSSSSSSSSSKSSSKSCNSKKSAPAAQREAPPVASYSDGKLAVLRGDKVLWKYPRNRLPKEYFKGDWPLKA